MSFTSISALILIVLTLVGVAVGRYPWLRMNRATIALPMATTLAGNLTLLGSVANLIVAETARNRGVKLSFGEYLKAGVPITIGTLVIGILWLIQWGR